MLQVKIEFRLKLFNLQSWTKLDKITSLERTFLDILAVVILPSPSPWKQCCCALKESMINFELGEEVFFTQSH